jgi:hypothetical protein
VRGPSTMAIPTRSRPAARRARVDEAVVRRRPQRDRARHRGHGSTAIGEQKSRRCSATSPDGAASGSGRKISDGAISVGSRSAAIGSPREMLLTSGKRFGPHEISPRPSTRC